MILRALGTFGFSLTVLMMPVPSNAQGGASGPENRITILYDAFGKDTSMRKDYAHLMTIRILERLDEPKRPASRPNMGGRESNNSYRAAAHMGVPRCLVGIPE